MKKWKQCLVAALAVVMVSGSVSASTARASEVGSKAETGSTQMQADVQDGLLAYYDFAEKPSDGKTVENKAGNDTIGAAIVENDAKAEWKDGALVMSGEGKSNSPVGPWVSLPGNLFTGKESATITMEVCPSASIINKNHFMWSIGNTATDLYWFANTYGPRTSIKYGGSEKTASSSWKLSADRWYSYTGVIDAEKKTISLYIDGVKVAETSDSGMSLAKVTDQSRNTIGRAPFNDDLFSGSVATFRAYGRALTDEEIQSLADEDGRRFPVSSRQSAARQLPGH